MIRILLAVSALALTASVSLADPVSERKELMKAIGAGVGAMAPIARGEQPFDAERVTTALANLNAAAEQLDVEALFPEGSDTGDTAALPAIWENKADFTEKMEKLKADIAAVGADAPQDQAGVGAALGRIGGNCGACHETYRARRG